MSWTELGVSLSRIHRTFHANIVVTFFMDQTLFKTSLVELR